MTAKGIVTGNGPADQLLERFRTELTAPVNATSKQEIAGAWVELKRGVRAALPEILAAERRRTIASARGRLDRAVVTGTARVTVAHVLDEMEREATS